ncbi:MAG: response regulator transcription factor [Actinomycetota bacterium]
MTEGHLLLVDDHPLIALALGERLASDGPSVDAVSSVAEARVAIDLRRPDLCIVDLDLGADEDGLVLLEELVSSGLRAVMLTGSRATRALGQALRLGAVDVLDKTTSPDDIALAVGEILETGRPAGGAARRAALLEAADRESRDDEARGASLRRLTDRELEVLAGLVDGRSVDEIAAEQTVAVSTVRTHVRRILEKLGVRSQLAAVAEAHRSGWPPDRLG